METIFRQNERNDHERKQRTPFVGRASELR